MTDFCISQVGDGSHAGSWRRLLFSVTPLIYRRLYYLITIDYPMYIIILYANYSKGMFAEHFDMDRYHVLVLSNRILYIQIFNVKHGGLIMHRTLKARDWYGLAFNEVVSEVIFHPSTGGGSARDVSGILEFEALKPHQQMSETNAQ